MEIDEFVSNSLIIREHYHNLEDKYHGLRWSIEEDALAFLTDASLVGRYTMSKENRWPSDYDNELSYKIGESVWWLCIIAERQGIKFEDCLNEFLNSKKKSFGI